MARKCELMGVGVMTGNKVSHSNRKTRTRFLPNLMTLTFASDSLKRNLKIKLAASTLRTVNKYGNIDSFLVNVKSSKLTPFAQKLKTQIKKYLIVNDKLSEVRVVKKTKAS